MNIFFPAFHLSFLMIAPQLWVGPFLGLRTDYIILPLWFLYLIISGKLAQVRFGPQERFFLFWVFWLSISMLANGVFSERFDTHIFFYIKWFVLYIMIVASLENIADIKIYCFAIVFYSSILAIEGIDHFHAADGLGWAGQHLGWSEGAHGRTQWIGIFDGPGVFCVVYTIAWPFLLIMLNKTFGFSIRILGIGLLGLLCFAIYLNGSRGGLLATLTVTAIFYGYKYLKKSKFLGITVPIVMFVGILGIAPSHMTELSDSHRSGAHRVEMWAEGCEMIKQNPVFGIGRGGFAKYTGSLIAHNSFVELMGETGMPGFFAWLALIYFSFKQLFCFIKENGDKPEKTRDVLFCRALAFSIIGYLFSAMFVTLEYETLYMLFALCAAFGRSLKTPIEITYTDWKRIAFIEIAWIVSINAFTTLFGPGYFS